MTLSVEARDMLRGVNVATLTNCLLSRGLRNIFLHGISPVAATAENMVGEAFTMRFIPAREDIDNMAAYARPDHVQRRAIEECPAGSVLVIDSRGDARAASAGDLLVARLKARGAAGIVTDGGFRDVAGVANTGLPAYQKQTASPASPIIHHAADLNRPIGCAGVAVYPGDIVVGDREGVVVFPAKFAEEVAREAYEATLYEEFADAEIRRGRSIFGLFPATDESRKQYQEWRKQQGKVTLPR
jgi:regulator of RNase E activity RraA